MLDFLDAKNTAKLSFPDREKLAWTILQKLKTVTQVELDWKVSNKYCYFSIYRNFSSPLPGCFLPCFYLFMIFYIHGFKDVRSQEISQTRPTAETLIQFCHNTTTHFLDWILIIFIHHPSFCPIVSLFVPNLLIHHWYNVAATAQFLRVAIFPEWLCCTVTGVLLWWSWHDLGHGDTSAA